MNTLKIEQKLADKYGYMKLPETLSQKYRNFFLENIPSYLKIDGDNSCLYTKKGSLVCRRYNRIVIGDYGAFVEFSKEDVGEDFHIKDGQEYRIFDRKYSKNVKYLWYTINDGSDIKIYYQKRKVNYADYKRGMYYVSVHEVKAVPCHTS